MYHIFVAILGLMSLLALYSCREQNNVVSQHFGNWIGREIHFPDNVKFTILNDTVDYDINSFDYKIFTYVDSSDCTICRLKLMGWDKLLANLSFIKDLKIGLIQVISTKMTDEIKDHMRASHYLHPVYFDTKGQMDSLNHFLHDYNFQTFLLDASNHIVAIGNPLNNNILNVFLEEMRQYDYIKGEMKTTDYPIKVDRMSQSIGFVGYNKVGKCHFFIKNTLKTPISIKEITTSCPCTEASSNRDSILPEEYATILVRYRSNETEREFSNLINISFNEIEVPILLEINGYN